MTHSFIYSHSQHTIKMLIGSVSEASNPDSIPQWLIYIIPVAMIAAVIAGTAVVFKRRKTKTA